MNGLKIGGCLSKNTLTEEEKEANRKRLTDAIESWKKFELEHPELAKAMTCVVKGVMND